MKLLKENLPIQYLDISAIWSLFEAKPNILRDWVLEKDTKNEEFAQQIRIPFSEKIKRTLKFLRTSSYINISNKFVKKIVKSINWIFWAIDSTKRSKPWHSHIIFSVYCSYKKTYFELCQKPKLRLPSEEYWYKWSAK